MPEQLTKAITELSLEVHGLKDEVKGEREDRRREQKRERWRLLSIFAVGLLALLLVAMWNRNSIQESNHQFCSFVQSQAEAAQGSIDPPGTAGRKSAAAAAELYRNLGCD